MEDNALTRITEKVATINSISEIESFQKDLKTICDSRWNELLRCNIENHSNYFELMKLYPKMNNDAADLNSCRLFVSKVGQLISEPIDKAEKFKDFFIFDEYLEEFVSWKIDYVFTEKIKLFLPAAIKAAKNEKDISHLKYWIRSLPEVKKNGIFEELLEKKECDLRIKDTYRLYSWNKFLSYNHHISIIFLYDDLSKKD